MISRLTRRARHAAAACLFFVLTGAADAAQEPAKSADGFVDSIGVNTHYGNAIFVGSNAYADPAIDQKLVDLGVRHIRDHSYNDTGVARVGELYKDHGIRATLILGETTRSPADLVNLMKANPAYEAIEGLNEPDLNRRSYNGFTDRVTPNTYPATRAFQNDLYAALDADPQTKDLPVLSPAMSQASRAHFLEPIDFDVTALHSYPWASSNQTSNAPTVGIDLAMNNIASFRGTKPLWATETGYFNRSTDARRVSEAVAAKYIPRLLGEFFNRGIERSYLYELADQGPDANANQQNFGLVRYDMTEKPAFVALENLIDLVQEPDVPANFAPGKLDYALSLNGAGDLTKVHHTLLQKSNGAFYLMLWQEVAGWDSSTNPQSELSPAPLSVTLTLNDGIAQARTYLTNQSLTPTGTYANPTSITLDVPDQMLVVELTPAAVPEPGGMILLGGVASWGLSARRKRRR
jgi:hypothetical protein